MNSNQYLAAFLLLLPVANVIAAEEEPEWDVSVIPGDAREVSIDTRSGT